MMNHKPTEPPTHCPVDGTLCEGQGTIEQCAACSGTSTVEESNWGEGKSGGGKLCHVDNRTSCDWTSPERCRECNPLRRQVMRATQPFPTVSEMEMMIIKRIKVLEEALRSAAKSLEVVAGFYAGKVGEEKMTDSELLIEVRQYAASRAMMAKKALEEK